VDPQEQEAREAKAQAVKEKEAGNAAYKAKDFPKAIQHYDSAIKLDDSDISFLTNRYLHLCPSPPPPTTTRTVSNGMLPLSWTIYPFSQTPPPSCPLYPPKPHSHPDQSSVSRFSPFICLIDPPLPSPSHLQQTFCLGKRPPSRFSPHLLYLHEVLAALDVQLPPCGTAHQAWGKDTITGRKPSLAVFLACLPLPPPATPPQHQHIRREGMGCHA